MSFGMQFLSTFCTFCCSFWPLDLRTDLKGYACLFFTGMEHSIHSTFRNSSDWLLLLLLIVQVFNCYVFHRFVHKLIIIVTFTLPNVVYLYTQML